MSASADISKLIKGVEQAQQRAAAAARRGLDVAGEMVVGNAQQLTPVKTGALQASGTTEPAEVHGTRISKTIGFNTDYAAAVHEVLTNQHEIGQAKFLETAMRESAEKVKEFVAGEVRKAF